VPDPTYLYHIETLVGVLPDMEIRVVKQNRVSLGRSSHVMLAFRSMPLLNLTEL